MTFSTQRACSGWKRAPPSRSKTVPAMNPLSANCAPLKTRLTGARIRCPVTTATRPSSAAPTGPSSTTEARLAAKLSETRARATVSRAGAESQTRNSRASTASLPQSSSAKDDVAMKWPRGP